MDPGEAPPATTADEALGRALEHARSAVCEALAAVAALLEAAALASLGPQAMARPWVGGAVEALESLRSALRGESERSAQELLEAVFEALDSQISRWEEESRHDPDARGVLRALLALRELLWEFAPRRSRASPPKGNSAGRSAAFTRVPVEGDEGPEGPMEPVC